MATPITWQNINAPSFGEANRLMGLAQQSILGAFESGKTALNETQAFDKELWKRQDQEATQDALSKIYQAQTADQMNALNQSGALDQAVAANGARIDRAAVNALRDGRPQLLNQRNLQDLKYGEDKLLLEQAGVTAEGLALAQKQDPEAFNAWIAANPQNRKMADVLGMNRTVQQSVEDQTFQRNQDTRAGNLDTRAEALQPGLILAQQSNLQNDASTRALQRAQAEKFRADAARDAEAARKAAAELKSGASAAKAIDAAYKEFVKGSALDGGTLDTEDGKKTLREGINDLLTKKILDKNDVSDIYDNLSKYFKEGVPVKVDEKTGKLVYLPLPANVVMEAIAQSADNTFAIGFSRQGDHVAELIANRFGFDTKMSPFKDKGEFTTNVDLEKNRDNTLVDLLTKANSIRLQREQRLDGALTPQVPTALANTLRDLVRNTAAADSKKQK